MLKILIFYSRKFQLPERAVARFSGKTPSDNSIKPSLRKTNVLEHTGFSLVEILMALLVASLLMTALAPVMTKKINESLNINGDFNPKNNTIKKEILFGSNECPASNIKTAEDGSEYCEGTYTVPADYTGVIRVTVIGAGGGGGTAPTAGLTEFKEAGSTTFIVPAMVNQIEATLVSGGAGGAGGGIKQKIETFVTDGTPSGENGEITRTSTGEGVWKPSSALNNAWVKISACGGGGGGVIGASYSPLDNFINPGHGAYFANKMFQLPPNSSTGISYHIGGKGGHFIYASPAIYTKGVSNGGSSAGYATQGCTNKAKGGSGNDASGDGSNACCNDNNENNTSICLANGGIAPIGAGNGGRGGKSILKHSWGSRSAGGGAGSLQGFGGDGGEGSHSAAAGGGGGGSTWLGGTMADINSMIFQVGGGGGGAGPASNFRSANSGIFPSGGGGGGGAGMAGYEGGNGGGAALIGAIPETIPATSGGNASSSPVFGIGYCLGGTSGRSINIVSPSAAEAKNGAMRITYIDYGPGGSGGGAGNIVPIQKYSVGNLSDGKINILIGAGGKGGSAGITMNSNGSFTWPTIGFPCNTGEEPLRKTELTDKNGNVLLTTYAQKYEGGWGGHPSGVIMERTSGGGSTLNWQLDQAGSGGAFMLGVPLPDPPYYTRIDENSDTVKGFVSGNGYTAGDKKEQSIGKTYADGTIGGRGGTLQTPWYTCNFGAGGTEYNKDGKDGAAGGCGGGGGYSFGKGGNGGNGYARISWNKYWNVATNAYGLANVGTGGGGATGNVMTYSIKVMGNQAIRIRIGKGGKGAEIVNNNVIASKKGGDTIFGDDLIGEIRAGGGGGGSSPSIVNNNRVSSLINGVGGSISSKCHFGGKSYLNNKSYCTKGLTGFNAEPESNTNKTVKGANGASLPNFGTGGEGGIAGTSSYLGGNATGYGSGGGGASIYDLGDTSINSTSGTNKGGDGSNGKIIIELHEG